MSDIPFDQVPVVVEETGRGERAFDVYSKLLNERIVLLGTPIDGDTASLMMAQLVHLEAENPNIDINLYVNSPGGDVPASLTIYDTMQYVTPDVSTIVLGQASETAAVVALAGAKGKRCALPHSRVMLHQPRGTSEGPAIDVELQSQEVTRHRKLLDELIARHTGQPLDRVSKDTDRDFVLSAREAVEYGAVDDVITSR
jgi:ATP-dependent Clp protease protease subunit